MYKKNYDVVSKNFTRLLHSKNTEMGTNCLYKIMHVQCIRKTMTLLIRILHICHIFERTEDEIAISISPRIGINGNRKLPYFKK